jgi:hypothetical protein
MITCTIKIRQLPNGSVAISVDPVLPADHTEREHHAAMTFQRAINRAIDVIACGKTQVAIEGDAAADWERKFFG